jgi:NTE family protein
MNSAMPTDVEQPAARVAAQDRSQGPAQGARRRPREGIALCLSGGGFRAALFHVGALRRLNELGVLSQVNTYSCISGGSIVGGYLAHAIAGGMTAVDGRYADLDQHLDKFVAFTQRDIRTLPTLARLRFWEPAGRAPRAIAKYYERLVGKMPLSALPDSPRFTFCATNLFFANSWICERRRVGDFLSGYARPTPEWTLARAMAASSCFPPVFDPLPAGLDPNAFSGQLDDDQQEDESPQANAERLRHARTQITLTDGGVYDNLGLEPVWKRHATILVSDGGKPLQHRYVMPGLRLLRYNEVIQNQVLALRKRWLIDTFQRSQHGTDEDTFNGTYWGIMGAVSSYDRHATQGYTKGLAATIANVRTDLNAFSPNEAAVLEKHGYELADMAIRTHKPVAFADQPSRPWPARLVTESTVQAALKCSASRFWSTFCGRKRDLLR